jgi:hypothetical protein
MNKFGASGKLMSHCSMKRPVSGELSELGTTGVARADRGPTWAVQGTASAAVSLLSPLFSVRRLTMRKTLSLLVAAVGGAAGAVAGHMAGDPQTSKDNPKP